MSRTLRLSVVVSFVLLAPALAAAQSTIIGVVRDSSGAVLPGVTVEASSDVLIERVRTAVTDSEGAYRLVDLRPGTYDLSFALPGFTSFKRTGLDPAGRVHRNHQRRAADWGDRGVDYRHRRIAGRGHDQRGAHPRAGPRGDGRHSHRPQHPGHGPADRRHQPQPARHRRRPRHAADLHVHARHDPGQQHRAGGRHDGQRPAARRRRAELLQRRDERRGQLPDERRRRRHGGGRRALEHDSARRRQPLQRRRQVRAAAGRLAVQQSHRAPHRHAA